MSSKTPGSERDRPACAALVVPLALVGALSLGACSGGTGEGPDNPGTSAASGQDRPTAGGEQVDGSSESRVVAARYGQVIIGETVTDQDEPVSRVAARFVALTAEAMTHTEMLERTVDTCDRVPDVAPVPGEHDVDDARPAGGELPLGDELLAGELHAGETIVLSGPSGTWSTLLPSTVGGARLYLNDSSDSLVGGRIPSGLVIDIPGNTGFPGFAAIAMPDPQPGADSFVPANGSWVDVTTEFRWASSTATGSRVHLVIRDDNGRLDCFAADDGLFSLAEAVVGGSGLGSNAILVGVAREATRIERSEDATLVLTVATQRP